MTTALSKVLHAQLRKDSPADYNSCDNNDLDEEAEDTGLKAKHPNWNSYKRDKKIKLLDAQ